MMKGFVKEEVVDKVFNILLLAIACSFFFRKLSTVLIIVLSIYCVFFCRKMTFDKRAIILCIVTSAPFIVELVLLWNNANLGAALKGLEKYSSLPIFSIFIVGNWRRVYFNYFLLRYAQITSILITFLIGRFCWLFPEKVALYTKGEYLWEAGYVLTESFGNHAPNVNLHMSFVTCILIYYILKDYYQMSKWNRILNIILYFCAFISVILINTRVSLFTLFLGNFIIFFTVFKGRFFKAKNNSKSLYIRVLLGVFILFSGVGFTYYNVPYMKDKYSDVTFAHLDKIGKLDEIENPESKIFNSFVTRVTIWKSGKELIAKNNFFIGVGSTQADSILYNYYKETDQKFLYQYKLGIHNQYVESFFKYGLIGFVGFTIFIFFGCYLGIKTKNTLVFVFGLNIVISNFFDSFIALFMGIVYTGLFLSVFISYYLQRLAVNVNSK